MVAEGANASKLFTVVYYTIVIYAREILATLYFLRNLQMGPISLGVCS
jgi:hypothetical protein